VVVAVVEKMVKLGIMSTTGLRGRVRDLRLQRRGVRQQLVVQAGAGVGGEGKAREEVGVKALRMWLYRVVACSKGVMSQLQTVHLLSLPRQPEEREGAGAVEVAEVAARRAKPVLLLLCLALRRGPRRM
jgi:hypothetical protein